MILVDTSVWVDHLRSGNAQLAALLDEGDVVCHPFIITELACGTLPDRAEILKHLQALPQAYVASQAEIMDFIETHRLMGIGLGFVDVHLLASARLSMIPLWTRDLSLNKAAAKLDVLFPLEKGSF
jgi:predicted nucleic acid-binding protein